MKKCKMKYLILIMVLLLIPIVVSLEECKRVMNPGEIPCILVSLIKSKWVYTNSCNTYTADIYNSNSTLLDARIMGDYLGRCNITFNYTTPDSYYINFSQKGDSAIIIIEKEDNMIAIIIGLIFVMIFFAVFGFVFDSWGAKIFGYGVALIQLLNIVYILYINELNMSLAPILKINFTSVLWLAFGIGLIGMIRLSLSLISMGKGADDAKEDKKWGRVD